MADLPHLLSVARGQTPADCILGGGRIVNVLSGEIERADIAIADGIIAGIGPGYQAARRVDLKNSFVAPGLIDAHVHIESSLCVPSQFAAALIPRGVTGVVADPHEIANVLGAAGVRFMADASRNLPLEVTIMAPSCVPATNLASAGGEITAADVRELRGSGIAHGLAEMMNFPGLLAGDAQVLQKLSAMHGRPIDGHAPGLSGHRLNAYIAAGVGSDHESVSADEAREKLSRGIFLMIREATNARNLNALLPIITPANNRRICFCTDDRTPVELLEVGSIDEMVRRAIAFGIDPIVAIRMATFNPAELFGLGQLGAIAPGRLANVFVFDDLEKPRARAVFSRGELVAESGKLIAQPPVNASDANAIGSCRIDWDHVRWEIAAKGQRVRVIGSLPDQLLTEHRILPAKIVDGRAVADVSADMLKMLVIERHKKTGNNAAGFIQGFGLKRGAMAGTFAHDHHNLVTIGADDLSMQTASRAVAKMGGGLAVAVGQRVVAMLALPIAGLMSDRPIAEVAAGYAAVVSAARELGSTLADPFMAMSFMTLEVIPALKLTDRGLVDVVDFKLVDLFV
ncbi:MAG TPA: adenine deaminase [Tepidisphaeraceae bacterium]|jgi:adenine deaminase